MHEFEYDAMQHRWIRRMMTIIKAYFALSVSSRWKRGSIKDLIHTKRLKGKFRLAKMKYKN